MDTLKSSRHANMKELRFKVDNGVWCVALAFDPQARFQTGPVVLSGFAAMENDRHKKDEEALIR